MRNLILRGGLIVALLALVWGGKNPSSQAEDDFLSPAKSDERAGVMVLKTGQLVEGRISPSPGGYLVELPKGSYMVPLERVSVVADDRHGAYKKLKATQPTPTPDFQVALARWCIAWKLYEEARVELRDALVAQPEHKEARQMYARLHQLMHPEQQAAIKPKPKTAEGFQPSEPESLAGLSPETAKQYVIRVQPLLLNRCGNAGCHGPSSGQDFELTHIRGRLNKQTIANLEMVLKFVDVSSPEDSPLLTTPSGTHGKNGKPIFYGSTGEQNLETLKAWITQAAGELKGDAPQQAQRLRPPRPLRRKARRNPLPRHAGGPESRRSDSRTTSGEGKGRTPQFHPAKRARGCIRSGGNSIGSTVPNRRAWGKSPLRKFHWTIEKLMGLTPHARHAILAA